MTRQLGPSLSSDKLGSPFLATATVTVLLVMNFFAPVVSKSLETFALLLVAGVVFELLSKGGSDRLAGSGWPALSLAIGFPGLGAGWLFSLHLVLQSLIQGDKGQILRNLGRVLPVVVAVTYANFGPDSYRLLAISAIYLLLRVMRDGFSALLMRKACEDLLWAGLILWSSSFGMWPLLAVLVTLLGLFSWPEVPTAELRSSLASQMSTAETTLRTSQQKHQEDREKFKGLLSLQALFSDFQGRALRAADRRDLAGSVVEVVAEMNPDCQCALGLWDQTKLSFLHGAETLELSDFTPLPPDLKMTGMTRSADGKRAFYPLDGELVFLLKVEAWADQKFFEFLEHLLARASLILQILEQSRQLGILLQEKSVALEQLAESQRQLLQAEKLAAIGQLAAGIAHELNSPLAAIQLQNNLARKRLAKNDLDGVSKSVATSELASKKAKGIIEGLLTYSRLSQDDSSREQIYLKAVVGETIQLLEERLKSGDVTLTTEMEELPPLSAHAREIYQILTNILLNALDALMERPQQRQLSIVARELDGGQEIVIFNNGPAIAEETLERIFEPFFTTKDIGSGTGLGLSIAHELAVNHRGRLSASNETDGVSFRLFLPGQ